MYVEFSELTFSECATCGIVFRTREQPNLLPAGFYEQSYFHGRKSGRDRRFEHRVRKAQSWISDCVDGKPDAASLLDVGCSFGYVLEGARRLGLTAAGVDISEYAVERCRALGFDAKVGAVDAIPYPDASFDVVIMKHVLEHTPSPLKALSEAKRVMKPGGQLLIAVPDLDYWKGRWWRKRGRYFVPSELGAQHYVYFHADGLARALSSQGFEVKLRSKAYLRRQVSGRAFEALRYVAMRAWQGLAAGAHLRRELYFVGQSPLRS